MLLITHKLKDRSQKKKKKEFKHNENTTCQTIIMWMKKMIYTKMEFMSLNAYIRKGRRYSINDKALSSEAIE